MDWKREILLFYIIFYWEQNYDIEAVGFLRIVFERIYWAKRQKQNVTLFLSKNLLITFPKKEKTDNPENRLWRQIHTVGKIIVSWL